MSNVNRTPPHQNYSLSVRSQPQNNFGTTRTILDVESQLRGAVGGTENDLVKSVLERKCTALTEAPHTARQTSLCLSGMSYEEQENNPLSQIINDDTTITQSNNITTRFEETQKLKGVLPVDPHADIKSNRNSAIVNGNGGQGNTMIGFGSARDIWIDILQNKGYSRQKADEIVLHHYDRSGLGDGTGINAKEIDPSKIEKVMDIIEDYPSKDEKIRGYSSKKQIQWLLENSVLLLKRVRPDCTEYALSTFVKDQLSKLNYSEFETTINNMCSQSYTQAQNLIRDVVPTTIESPAFYKALQLLKSVGIPQDAAKQHLEKIADKDAYIKDINNFIKAYGSKDIIEKWYNEAVLSMTFLSRLFAPSIDVKVMTLKIMIEHKNQLNFLFYVDKKMTFFYNQLVTGSDSGARLAIDSPRYTPSHISPVQNKAIANLNILMKFMGILRSEGYNEIAIRTEASYILVDSPTLEDFKIDTEQYKTFLQREYKDRKDEKDVYEYTLKLLLDFGYSPSFIVPVLKKLSQKSDRMEMFNATTTLKSTSATLPIYHHQYWSIEILKNKGYDKDESLLMSYDLMEKYPNNLKKFIDEIQKIKPRTGYRNKAQRETFSATNYAREVALKTLGIASNASEREIRSAYFSAIRAHHPDKHTHLGDKEEAHRKTQAIIAAYALLKQ